MTKKELQSLKVGTLLHNGRTEGTIKMDGDVKCIEVLIPIDSMANDAKHYNERPQWWDVLEDYED